MPREGGLSGGLGVDPLIRDWWNYVYRELANDMHLNVETEEELDFRLGDSEAQWRAKSSKATQA